MKKPLKTSPESRKCSFPGCKCILSIYNHAVLCRVHRDKVIQEQKPTISSNFEVQAE